MTVWPSRLGVGGLPPFRPLPGPTHFLCLAKESKQRKARPRWRKTPWIFVAGREGRQTRFAQTSLPSFSSPQQKSKAPSRAGTSKAKPTKHCGERHGERLERTSQQPCMRDEVAPRNRRCALPLPWQDEMAHWHKTVCFALALDGALNLCKRAGNRRETV